MGDIFWFVAIGSKGEAYGGIDKLCREALCVSAHSSSVREGHRAQLGIVWASSGGAVRAGNSLTVSPSS